VCLKDDSYTIFNSFILYNGPQVKVKCNISFDKKSNDQLYIPRLIFFKEDNYGHVKETENKKVIIEFNKSEIGLENFWRLVSFLKRYKDLVDTGDFDKKYKVVNGSEYITRFKTKEEAEQVEELKKMNIDISTLQKYLKDTRKIALDVFRKLLEDECAIKEYKTKNNIKQQGEESAWHHFLKNNDWILGLNADLRFIRDFCDETKIGNPNTDGVGNPTADMMGLSDYTVLIELKTASTNFFTEVKTIKSRAGTWSFTDDFIEGISQCLAQKSEWDKGQKSKDLMLDGEVQDQRKIRTVDPNIVFIIGNKQKELNIEDFSNNNFLKRDTLERFKQNSKNVEIITYDELYERAYFIVHHEKPEKLIFKGSNVLIEDMPF
jgi:hypothetical protein